MRCLHQAVPLRSRGWTPEQMNGLSLLSRAGPFTSHLPVLGGGDFLWMLQFWESSGSLQERSIYVVDLQYGEFKSVLEQVSRGWVGTPVAQPRGSLWLGQVFLHLGARTRMAAHQEPLENTLFLAGKIGDVLAGAFFNTQSYAKGLNWWKTFAS